jgi:peptide/nickel transport system substrate-binding protein
MRMRNSTPLAALTAVLVAVLATAQTTISARAESVVRYGISMADIPLTTGQPDRGAGA